MLIDWFTVIAQIINFLILVWLLKRFLYKPILKAIDARETLVAEKLSSAENVMQKAEQEKEEYEKKNEDIDSKRADLIKKAKEEAELRKTEILDGVRKEGEAIKERWKKSILDQEKFLTESLSDQTQKEVIEIARKTLSDLSNSRVEERMIQVFISKIGNIDKEELAKIISDKVAKDNKCIIRSGFELTVQEKAQLEEVVKEYIGNIEVIYKENEADLIGGIELTFNDYYISWNIADYLQDFERKIKEHINDQYKIQLHEQAGIQEGA